jgi:adenine-specific DNA methylase
MSNKTADKRLIEVAFPLRQASIDSVHEKNVRHGHISTLHIWPARRPLAACRAALFATLLPDPGDKEKRDELLKRLGGTLKKTSRRKVMPDGRIEHIEAWETEGGILHWGRETGPDMDWFRAEIRKAYGGRAPRVLDPFAGGGAIPLEAMRLGCEVTAGDINPVAWFILKCTLEYPRKLAGQKRRLPEFALRDVAFLTDWFKARGLKAKDAEKRAQQVAGRAQAARHENLSLFDAPDIGAEELDADLAWHVRAWGRWVLSEARRKLARFYPTYAEYCSLKPYAKVALDTDEPLKLVPCDENGEPQTGLLNTGFDADWLENPRNPRWVAKPTVAYLWARTVHCKACRAEVPLLKTRWLAKKDAKRVVLTMRPLKDNSGVEFGIDYNAKPQGGNAARRREYDKKLGAGTMSRAGVTCPCCGTIMTMEDLRMEGRVGRMDAVMTAVVTESPATKEYRLPTTHEREMVVEAAAHLEKVYADIPFGFPAGPTPKSGSGASRAFSVDGYGLDQWYKLFTPRQLLGLGSLVTANRKVGAELQNAGYSADWLEAIVSYNAIVLDKTADYGSSLCTWHNSRELIGHTFARFALPMIWDIAELSILNEVGGGWLAQLDWVARYVEYGLQAVAHGTVKLSKQSAIAVGESSIDVIVTDPPYYDAIPYSDLMDFFYVWLRRTLRGLSVDVDAAFSEPLSPKWSHEKNDGELIDDASRFDGNRESSKRNYEEGMSRVFKACHAALNPDGRLVIVFAHKHPDAWETLVGAIIKAGFVVDGSWPIQTEMGTRMRAMSSAALSSSVWLVCKKRDPLARAGWDAAVLREMETGITVKLRDFWDAGIRGPDFVWAATGPAMEAYSRYPAVKKASEPGQLMTVSQFLGHVRRIVVDFVVGRVLTHGEPTPGDHPLDDITTYYLLHRHDFGLKGALAGPCILYAVSCSLSERELVNQYDLLARGGGGEGGEADDEDDDTNEDANVSGGMFRLKTWNARKQRSLGQETSRGGAIPLIDQVHKLMQLWVAGDVVKVNDYLDARSLRHSQVFVQLIQALIEQSRFDASAEECSILERLQNYLKSLGGAAQGKFDIV